AIKDNQVGETRVGWLLRLDDAELDASNRDGRIEECSEMMVEFEVNLGFASGLCLLASLRHRPSVPDRLDLASWLGKRGAKMKYKRRGVQYRDLSWWRV